jgi:hypothetical protein
MYFLVKVQFLGLKISGGILKGAQTAKWYRDYSTSNQEIFQFSTEVRYVLSKASRTTTGQITLCAVVPEVKAMKQTTHPLIAQKLITSGAIHPLPHIYIHDMQKK